MILVNQLKILEKLYPEEAQDLTSQCLNFMTEEIQRYEGTTALYTGYGVMGLFGAPAVDPKKEQQTAAGTNQRLFLSASYWPT